VLQSLIESLRRTRAEADAEANVVGFLGEFFHHLPFPAYIKAIQPDGRFRLVRVNRAFEAAMGVEAQACLARTDEEVMDAEYASLEAGADQACIAERGPVSFRPSFFNRHHQDRQTWNGVKWPVYANGRVAAICGLSTVVETSL
jgi:hypothetical protein